MSTRFSSRHFCSLYSLIKSRIIKSRKMRNWSELPPEIVHSISLRIDNPFDLIHFRSVCSLWRSSSLLKFQHMTSLRCPLPLDLGGYGDDCHILSSRVYLIKSPNNGDFPRYWLFKLHVKENGKVVLHSLFRRRESCGYQSVSISVDLLNCHVFELAQEHVASYSHWLKDFKYVAKGTEERIGFMDLDAKQNEFMVIGKLTFQGLGMYRSVDERWTDLDMAPRTYFEGMVSFKGKFYTIDFAGITRVIEQSLEMNTFQRSRPCDKTRKRWLVNSGDKLLLVEMCTVLEYNFNKPNIRGENIWFEISELNEEGNDWDQVKDVDGRVLLLDIYCSFSCLATEIPGFRANCILFMDMHESLLVFEFDEKGVRSLYDIPEYVHLFQTPPGWVISNE